jgi:hypothetical protein
MKKFVTNHIVTIISAITLSALAILYGIFENLLLNLGKTLQLSELAVLRLVFAILWLGLVALAFYLREKYKCRLKVYCGLYWDKKLNPYCNSCKSPVTFYSVYKGYKSPLFYCSKCNAEIEATDENGNALSLVEIKKLIKNT